MKVVKSEILGFCFGVRRAVDLAKKALVENNQKKVYSLGPLIHNEFVLDNLKNQGLIIVEENEIEKIEDESVVIIRAHGVSPEVINQLSKKKWFPRVGIKTHIHFPPLPSTKDSRLLFFGNLHL